jgi:hypothetical protein
MAGMKARDVSGRPLHGRAFPPLSSFPPSLPPSLPSSFPSFLLPWPGAPGEMEQVLQSMDNPMMRQMMQSMMGNPAFLEQVREKGGREGGEGGREGRGKKMRSRAATVGPFLNVARMMRGRTTPIAFCPSLPPSLPPSHPLVPRCTSAADDGGQSPAPSSPGLEPARAIDDVQSTGKKEGREGGREGGEGRVGL